jgi:putative hemolysin
MQPLDLIVVFLLPIANAFFVMSEMAVVSARKVRLQQMANQGDTRAQAALQLANAPNRFLAIVQAGITLIIIVSGAFGERVISTRLAPVLDLFPLLTPYSEAIASAIAVFFVTYLTLVIGELVPKRLALNNPERIAAAIAMPMQTFAIVASPIVYLLSASTDLLVWLSGIKPSTAPEVTEEEIKVLLEQGTEAGTFEAAEQDMVEQVFRLGDRSVNALMTPRPDIVWLDLEDSAEENRKKMVDSAHSRFPVCQGDLDKVLGVIHVTDLLDRSLFGQPFDLTVSLRQAVYVPESTRGLKVLELFKQTGTHIMLVVDEYGITQGLVTLKDILEEIVGDVSSKEQLEEPQAVQREDGSWLLDGLLPIDEFFEIFNLEELPSEHQDSYQTLGGLVINHLGRLPAMAEHFEWEGLRFEIMNLDNNRVDKVLVSPMSSDKSANGLPKD